MFIPKMIGLLIHVKSTPDMVIIIYIIIIIVFFITLINMYLDDFSKAEKYLNEKLIGHKSTSDCLYYNLFVIVIYNIIP